MSIKKSNPLLLCLIVILIGITLFSGCNKEGALSEKENTNFTDSQLIESTAKQHLTETISSYSDTIVTQLDTIITIEETTTERKLTSEEIELINNMPDIVFVLSHKWSYSSQCEDYSNIRGFYITKSGEIKMYAFSDDEPNKYVSVIDVFDELEDNVCSEFNYNGLIFTQDSLDIVSKVKLAEQYENLLLVDKTAEIEQWDNPTDSINGYFCLYGVRTIGEDSKEIIFLSGWGDTLYKNTDMNAKEIYENIEDIFPDLELFYSGSRY